MIREDVKEYNHFYAYAIHKDMCMYMYVWENNIVLQLVFSYCLYYFYTYKGIKCRIGELNM